MLNQDIIQSSTSLWSSPVWIVPKKIDSTGTHRWRLIIDYCKLNAKTVDDKYHLPNISHMLDKLEKSQNFARLAFRVVSIKGKYHLKISKKTSSSTENVAIINLPERPLVLRMTPQPFRLSAKNYDRDKMFSLTLWLLQTFYS